jgi:hypothetical protein
MTIATDRQPRGRPMAADAARQATQMTLPSTGERARPSVGLVTLGGRSGFPGIEGLVAQDAMSARGGQMTADVEGFVVG